MYSFPNFEAVCCSMSNSYCCFLTCIQVSQETGKVVYYSHVFKNFPQFVVIHTVKGFSTPMKQRLRRFSGILLIFIWSKRCWHLISGSSAFLKSSMHIWKFSVHVLLKPSLNDFEHYLASMWNERNCIVAWTFFVIALLWYYNENWPFPVLWPLLSFPKLLSHWLHHIYSIIF